MLSKPRSLDAVAQNYVRFQITHDTHNFDAERKVYQEKFVKREIYSRSANFANIFIHAITNAGDSLIGLGAGGANLLLLGRVSYLNNIAREELHTSKNIVSNIFFNGLKVINPHAKLGTTKSCANRVEIYWIKKLTSCSQARKCAILYLITMIAARAMDLIIGVFAMPVSILAGGMSVEMNKRAYDGLKVTGVMRDVYKTAMMILKPDYVFHMTS